MKFTYGELERDLNALLDLRNLLTEKRINWGACGTQYDRDKYYEAADKLDDEILKFLEKYGN